MNTITTKYGTFNVTDNGKNGTIISVKNVKIAEFSNVSWWNWDSLENAIEQNIEIIEKRIEECFNKKNVTITKDNLKLCTHLSTPYTKCGEMKVNGLR